MPSLSSAAAELLRIDPAAETERICAAIHNLVFAQFRRKGAVVGVSGGIDSSVVAALCARALGQDRVLALLMPEFESASERLELARLLTRQLGIRSVLENISPILDGAACYRRRDEAIRSVIPEYTSEYKYRLALPDLHAENRHALCSIVVQSPTGETRKAPLSLEAYLAVVAACNFRQRARRMIEYYHADAHNYAVAGTPNKLEYDLGFFVKNGDGAADFKPIAHLYKSQVCQLARYLGIPDEIRRRPPAADAYSLPQSEEETCFAMPLEQMDLCLYGHDHGMQPVEIAAVLGLSEDHIRRAWSTIDARRKVAQYLHRPPVVFAE